MPELPEVETVRQGLSRLLVGKTVQGVKLYNSPRSFPNAPEQVERFLYGASVTVVRRRAKLLMIDLDSDYTLAIHLKMTGQLVFVGSTSSAPALAARSSQGALSSSSATDTRIERSAEISLGSISQPPQGSVARARSSEDFAGGHPNDSLIGRLPDRSTRVEIDFIDDSRLFFNDQRKFGWMQLMPTLEVEQLPFVQKLGPEPLDPQTTANEFIARIRRHQNMMIKPAFLDQSVIAGVGNIYADESLWAAKIHPATRVRNVSDRQLDKLFIELKKILQIALDSGGSTDKNYIDAEGRRGSYLKFARVFRREGQPCHRHPDQEIIKIRIAGRGTHICSVCQVVVEQ